MLYKHYEVWVIISISKLTYNP